MEWGPRTPQCRDFMTGDTVEQQNYFSLISLLPHSVTLGGSLYFFFTKKMGKAFVTSSDANHNILKTR